MSTSQNVYTEGLPLIDSIIVQNEEMQDYINWKKWEGFLSLVEWEFLLLAFKRKGLG